VPAAPSPGLRQSVLDRLSRPEDQLQVGIANILDFRPDLQLATSTAVGLSARFPFVTPPGTIVENPKIVRPRGSLFQKTKVLELTDGGFYDNSGSIVARDIVAELIRRLANDSRFKDFKESVRFHLIRFTDTPAKRQGRGASETGHFELVTPFVAYDAVRLSRGVLLANPPSATRISHIYLLDEWYEGSLNWLLSRDTKVAIEKRSSWLVGYENDVCCEVRDPVRNLRKRIPLTDQQANELRTGPLKIDRFVPNARPFSDIIDLVDRGVRPPSAGPGPGAAMPAPPPAAVTPTGSGPAPHPTPVTSPIAQ
jgi:hypothetical protein